jgi:hypothetical protein
MTTEKLRDMLHARPFKPFSIHLAEGTVIPVKHPEFVLITAGGRTAHVHTGRGEEVKIIDLLLVTHITTNGAGSKRSRTGRRKS